MKTQRLPSGLRVGVQLVRQGKAKYNVSITRPGEVSDLLAYLRKQDREHFLTIHLDTRNHILGLETVSIGSLNYSIVHPRECFKAAFLLNAAAVILVHNHPSGSLEASEEDISLTKRMVQAGKLLGIEVLDHIIISGAGYMSFKEKQLMPV
ncbi:MAG: repair protein RadC protein [Parcubacteria group bacterium GW2011_GWF2_50_9]|nr:MAG: repair protein RadC protein [Parcubacteria group bacterium GW2011_GWF2_50_9]